MALQTKEKSSFPNMSLNYNTICNNEIRKMEETSKSSNAAKPGKKIENPFSMPEDNVIYHLKQVEHTKVQERTIQKTLKAHEKTTYSSRMNATNKQILKDINASLEAEFAETDSEAKQPTNWTMGVAKDRVVEKEGMQEYIAKKREMFLVRFTLDAKRREMQRLAEVTAMEKRKLELTEFHLQEDAENFDAFLKENDRISVDVIKRAEAESNLKMETVMETKKINAQIMSVKSEIAKHEDTLKEYQLYKTFLDSLAPQEWKDTEMLRKRQQPAVIITDSNEKNNSEETNKAKDGEEEREEGKNLNAQDGEEGGEDLELYFTKPHQLLDIFGELEEQNLSLIQNSQETEESLDQMKNNIATQKKKMDDETEVLKQQIAILENAIQKEEERARELEQKSMIFAHSQHHQTDEEKAIEKLNRRVKEIYKLCIGDSESNISTIQMLTNIENRMEDLMCMIERMPPEKVEAAEKVKEGERKARQKRELLEAGKKMQEERLEREHERANAEIKQKKGKQLVYRSKPPVPRPKSENKQMKEMIQQEEEMAYFFRW